MSQPRGGESCSGGSCDSSCSSSACGQGACAGCSEGCCGEMSKMEKLLMLTHWAKKKLLLEKLKTKLEAKIGKQLDAEAAIAVDMFVAKWEMMSKKEEAMAEWQSKLDAVWES